MEIIKSVNIDWMKPRKFYLAFSALILGVGIWSMLFGNGIPLGIDFRGGTVVYVRFTEAVQPDTVRSAVEKAGIKESRIQRYDRQNENRFLIALDQKGANVAALDAGKQQIVNALDNSPLKGKYEIFNVEIVGPQVGEQLRNQAILATIYASIGMLIYLWFRFELIYGIASVIAVLHDTLFTVGIFSLTNTELSLTVIAALLTLIGYSMNDTIVIFDRIRETLKMSRRESMYEVINRSINQTLSRTILTSGLTFLTVLALYLFGGEVLHGFSFALVIGILIGTYSTIAVASPLVLVYHEWRTRSGNRASEAAAGRREREKARA